MTTTDPRFAHLTIPCGGRPVAWLTHLDLGAYVFPNGQVALCFEGGRVDTKGHNPEQVVAFVAQANLADRDDLRDWLDLRD